MVCLSALRLKADLPCSEDCHFIHCCLKLWDPLSITCKAWCNPQFCAIKINDSSIVIDLVNPRHLSQDSNLLLFGKHNRQNKKNVTRNHTRNLQHQILYWIIFFKQTNHFMTEEVRKAETVGWVNYNTISDCTSIWYKYCYSCLTQQQLIHSIVLSWHGFNFRGGIWTVQGLKMHKLLMYNSMFLCVWFTKWHQI